jgi:alkylhydroperoxidase family enzyme
MSGRRLPQIDAPPGKEGSLDPSDFIAGHLPGYATLFGEFALLVMAQTDLEPATLELARLRNANRMNCRLCMNLRRQSAVERGLDEELIGRLADADPTGLARTFRTVVELVDAFLESPGALPPDLVRAARSELTLEQLSQLLLSLVVWTGNRVLVSLGLDAPVEADRTTRFEYSPSGLQSYVGPGHKEEER